VTLQFSREMFGEKYEENVLLFEREREREREQTTTPLFL
jgi:hypothetical protein